MTKKRVTFQIPTKGASDPALTPVKYSALEVIEADRWVQSVESSIDNGKPATEWAEPGAASFTITISSEPNWFEALKIACFVPYLTAWYWTLSFAQRQLAMITR